MIKLVSIIAVIFLIAVMAAAPALYCQDEPQAKTIDGTVVSVDPQNSRIVIKSYENFTFSVPSDATIINEDGFDMRLSDIDTGRYVTVDYYDDKDGNHIIKHIEVAYNT